MDDKKNVSQSLDDFMKEKSPFSNMNFNIDSEYVDLGIGYDKDKGASANFTVDLNSISKPNRPNPPQLSHTTLSELVDDVRELRRDLRDIKELLYKIVRK